MLVLLVDVVGWYTAVRKGKRIHRNNIDQFVVLAGFFGSQPLACQAASRGNAVRPLHYGRVCVD